jgi:hypothetical protein
MVYRTKPLAKEKPPDPSRVVTLVAALFDHQNLPKTYLNTEISFYKITE